MSRRVLLLAATLAIGFPGWTAGQTPAAAPGGDAFAVAVAQAARTAVVADPPATLVYANRAIVTLRGTILARRPAERVAAAIAQLDRLVDEDPTAPVTTRPYPEAIVLVMGARPVLVIFPADVDTLGGETLESAATGAAARLQTAFQEAVEIRTPARLLRPLLVALAATALYVIGLWVLIRMDRRVADRVSRAAERRLLMLPGGEIMVGVAHAPVYVRRLFRLAAVILGLSLTYAWLAVVLRRFPYTRPWGESLRSGLFSAVASAGGVMLDQLPNLLTVLAIVVITRFVARLTTLAFHAVEEGRVTLPGIYPETTQPTRRIAVAVLWMFALVVSYKYLPGSDSEVFKGVSVFVGLIVSLGSTGVMNQVMSGLMITYSRALRAGDFVKLGEVEGTVVHLGTLSTKIRNARNEEITIPNAIVISHAATNYSRHAQEGVFAPTSLTIGYDVPWRQVYALLLLAAERTPGVRQAPKPVVLQTGLCDFYVQYTLLVCIDQPHRRYFTLDALHANIQDAFNEYGVQIMSPNYEADPSGPKVVPPSRWYSAPAVAPQDEESRRDAAKAAAGGG